jgi:hypothetical protein
MKAHHCLGGIIVVLAGGFAYYWHKTTKKSGPVSHNILSGNTKGYSSLMKLSPRFYNQTSMEGNSDQTENFTDAAMSATPWTLGHNGGDAMEISAGWTDFPDSYSAIVSHAWQQDAVSGSHL